VAAVLVALVSLALATILLQAANSREHAAAEQAARNADAAREQRQQALHNANLAQEQRREAEKQRDEAAKNVKLVRRAVDEFCLKLNGDPRLREHDLEGLRKELLQLAVPFYQELVSNRSDDPDILAEQANTLGQLAVLTQEIGPKTEAIGLFQKALDLYDRLLREHPSVPAHRRALGMIYQNLGTLYVTMGQAEQAEAHLRKALTRRKELAAAYPNQPDYQHDLASSHQSLGLWYSLTHMTTAAEQSYLEAQELWLPLLRDQPEVTAYQKGLAMNYINLAKVYHERHRLQKSAEDAASLLDRSEAALQKALYLQEKLTAAHPSPNNQNLLGKVHNNLAVLYLDRRPQQLDRAAASFELALRFRDQLAQTHPTISAYQRDLARTRYNLGILHLKAGRPKEAEASFLKAVPPLEKLVQAQPKDVSYAVELGQTYDYLGGIAFRARNQLALLEWSGGAIRTMDAVLKLNKDNPAARACLYRGLKRRAEVLTRLGQPAKALADWERALARTGAKDRDQLVLGQAITLALLGKHAQAVADAKDVAAKKTAPAASLYQAACVCSLSHAAAVKDEGLPQAERAKLAESYAALAIQLLTAAQTAGYFQTAPQLEQLKKDSDLDPLRLRGDFQELLRGLAGPGNQGEV
jgi:tetratricopeptide (TPR) repeat protein